MGDSKKKKISISQSQSIIKKKKLKWINFSSISVGFMVSCKSKAVVSENSVTSMKAKEYNSYHYDNKSDFSTLYIKAKVKYSDDRQSQM
jgi:hypothetical protein